VGAHEAHPGPAALGQQLGSPLPVADGVHPLAAPARLLGGELEELLHHAAHLGHRGVATEERLRLLDV
jgi:hypothetical protein